MSGRSVVSEVMDGAGPVSTVAAELKELEAAMADPDRANDMETIVARYGEVQGALRGVGRVLAGRSGARGPGGLELQPGDDGRRRGRPVGGLEDARGAGPHPPHAARRHAARRAEQPSGSREPYLAGGVPQGLRGRPADDLARPRVHEPYCHQGAGDRRRHADVLRGQLRVLRTTTRARREAAAGAVRAAAGDARQGNQVHRALQGARLARGPGAEPGEEARQDRAGRAAQAPPDRAVRVPAGTTLRRGRGQPQERAQGLW